MLNLMLLNVIEICCIIQIICYICALLFYRDKYQIMMVSIMFFLIKTVQYNAHDDTDLVFKDGWRGIPCVFMDLKSCYGCALM